MKRKSLLAIIFLSLIFIPTNVLALDKTYCEVYDKGSNEILKSELEEFENKLNDKVFDLNESFGIGKLVVYKYYLDKKVEFIEEKVETNKETIKVDELFRTKEEAENYYENLEVEMPFVLKNPIISEKEIEQIEKGDSITIKCKTKDCKEEIENIEQNLEDNQKLNKKINVITIDGEMLEITYKENGEIKYFNTIEDATKFSDEYKPTLEKYRFDKNEVIEDKYTVIEKKTFKELNNNNIFNTLEEAQNALDSFKEKYINVEDEKITKNRNTNKDIVEKDSIIFDTKEEYESWINNNQLTEENGKLEYEINEKETTTEKIVGPFEYLDKESSDNKKIELEKDGYVVNIETEKKLVLTGKINTFNKVDQSKDRYEISIDNDYFVIKQGADKVVVWTKEELDNTKKTEFLNTLIENDNSIKVSKIEDIIWITGEQTFDLTQYGNNMGKYTVTITDENIIMTCDKEKISHFDYGTLEKTEKIVKYIVSGKKDINITSYELSYVKTIYGFDYEVYAIANVDKDAIRYYIISQFFEQKQIEELTYSIDTINKYITYELSYDKYEINKIEKAKIDWNIIKCNYYIGNGVADYPQPPATGMENKMIFSFKNILLVIILSVINIKLLKKIF